MGRIQLHDSNSTRICNQIINHFSAKAQNLGYIFKYSSNSIYPYYFWIQLDLKPFLNHFFPGFARRCPE